MAKLISEGHHVEICIVTAGAPHLFQEALRAKVREEALRVHAELGVARCTFLDFPAPLLDQTARHEIADAIRERVYEAQADTVLIPHHGDIHHDHAVVFDTALVACRPINNCPVRKILAYETLSETEWAPPRGDTWFIPNVYVDIHEHLEAKIRAMRGYASQLKEAPHPRSAEGITSLAQHRRYGIGSLASEAFMLVRELL